MLLKVRGSKNEAYNILTCMIFMPVATLPVKESLSQPGCAVSSAPVSPSPWITLYTPSGTPDSFRIWEGKWRRNVK